MNKTLLLAGVAATLLAANVNAAELNTYVSGKLRYADMSNDVNDSSGSLDVDDNVFGASVAIGSKVETQNGAVRVELEYNKNEDAEKTYPGGTLKIDSQSLMVNAYYDINTGTKFTPYLGAGIGYAKVKGKANISALGSGSIDDNNFAWQIGAGVGYAVNENVSIDAGYRYVDNGDFSEYGINVDSTAHELYLGARYGF